MKKFLFLAAVIVALSLSATAQKAQLFPIIAGDTISTSASLDSVTKEIPVTAGYSALGIQVEGTKVSGTITAKAYLYSSLNGSTYTLTDSSAAFANSAGAQSVFFTKTGGLPYAYYKIQVRNVGGTTSTEVLAIKVYYVLRRFDRS